MIEFYLGQFPKFRNAFSYSDSRWEEDFHNEGFKSAIVVDHNHMIISMDDHEYTWFALKWG